MSLFKFTPSHSVPIDTLVSSLGILCRVLCFRLYVQQHREISKQFGGYVAVTGSGISPYHWMTQRLSISTYVGNCFNCLCPQHDTQLLAPLSCCMPYSTPFMQCPSIRMECIDPCSTRAVKSHGCTKVIKSPIAAQVCVSCMWSGVTVPCLFSALEHSVNCCLNKVWFAFI